ncbi:B12-binding domain-containing radical SAM protein [Vibrio sp. WXL210]|uniref:B12-binding domain-containing radical SAM protein n=1 Tax=Vibrio sp. WXL210 TaxID=3450709 RepID=UPI003EC86636
MRYEGKIYRPWPEANSVLIQVTLGCSINTCTFCTMFDDKRFQIRDLEDVFADIEQVRRVYPHVESLFLTDGNVLAARTDYLLKVLSKIRTTFPECQHIALYGGMNDFRRKTVEELKALKQAGLSLVYAGLESGDPVVLDKIKKRMTQEHVIEGMSRAKAAEIPVLLSFIFGLGGRERSKEHIEETTKLLNEVKPEQIAPMALAIQPGSELEKELERGEFTLPTQLQILEEEQYLLRHLNIDTYYWGDHGNNIVPQRGYLPDSQTAILQRIESAIKQNPLAKDNVIQTFAW